MALAFVPEENIVITLRFVKDEIAEELLPIADNSREFSVTRRFNGGRKRAVLPDIQSRCGNTNCQRGMDIIRRIMQVKDDTFISVYLRESTS